MIFSDEFKDGVFYGKQDFNIPYHMNFGAFILQNILNYKDKSVLINGVTREEITYREFAQRVVNIADSLSHLGVDVGDVVAVFSENRIEFILTACAVFCVGATVTFFNTSYGESELSHVINISKPKYIFLSGTAYDSHYENLQKHKMIRKFILYDDRGSSRSQNVVYFKDLVKYQVDLNLYKPVHLGGKILTTMILYSSGTTGPAKGAMITNLNLITTAYQPPPTKRDHVALSISPWCTCMGIASLLKAIIQGKTTVFLARFNEKQFLQTIETFKIGYMVVPPPLLVMLCKSELAKTFDLSSIEVVSSGGATTNLEVINQIKKRFPHIKCVLQGYGMTEATGALTFDTEENPREGSVGKVVPGIIQKIVDPDTGKVLGCREPGEVCIKGPVVFEGYIGIPSGSNFYPDGFYRTGDIGYYDEEGYFYIIDRIKELIKYNAWQVSPSELEAILLKHGDVKDAAVIGAPDSSAGELPTAFVVKKENSLITDTEIRQFVDTKVASWKKLRGGVIFVDSIPKNPSGKILRRQLKQLLMDKRKGNAQSKL
ncbi:4-coumarate--CoA ligase 1 [Pieris rapae]|uniref:4-coumarate--CoA ligase 1 n=1 Tax=Pieris rapae TaxID=64459 RepID=UPI001E280172|nr:4-coumarate--CoA ligase 1 [Pieris rapae]